MNIKIIGLVLIGLGILGFLVPAFTTRETKDVASVGDVKLQAKENETHVVPPLLAGGVLVVGIVLLGAGVMKRT
ncbi:MAG TPA: hypothetical protein VKP60_19695 [Magnetospirillaceae bacterium]|nr:hypothetical protein [Magnetospirillaceae bacterium]